jgi:alpha-L-fucosidase
MLKISTIVFSFAFFLLPLSGFNYKTSPENKQSLNRTVPANETGESIDKTKWFREAGFGMFIHWGLYSIPAGVWKGDPVEDERYINPYAEHIMMLNKIPLAEYAKLAETFNPTEFNADKIVSLAKNAGMKYLVYTTKHHEGFAMYNSKVSDYNIVKSTPYKKDPLKSLSEACKKEGIIIGLYYSLGRDWERPDAVAKENKRNTWDFPDKTGFSYQKYLDEKVKPQLNELLNNYGDIGMIWFDTPELTTEKQSQELEALVKNIQPKCLINTRVGNDIGDFKEMGDNYIPESLQTKAWECPATMAESWGYSILDTEEYWKSSDELIEKLVEIRAKGGNYLLNIGPDEKGAVPSLAIERLNDISEWMEVNSQAIYNSTPVDLKIHNGRFTQSGNNIYVHLHEQPHNNIALVYINPQSVKKVSLLTKTGEKKLDFSATGGKGIMISLPEKLPFSSVSVVKIETYMNK